MEPTLVLLSTSGGGVCDSPNEPPASSKMEKDFMGVSEKNSSFSNEAEIELGLGLSLGNGKNSTTSAKGSSAARGEFGRILTAKDFPNGFSSRGNNTFSGNKRAADSSAEVGSPPSNGGSQVVGWPPIRTYRMNSLVNQAKVLNVEQGKGVGGNEKEENSKKKCSNKDDDAKDTGRIGFVKVNMDGLPIGRKVDLNAYSCYKSLAITLEEMFFKSSPTFSSLGTEKDIAKLKFKLLDGSSEFVLTYEDKEGDWMLVGDVPWGMFVSTVRRLRIMKTSEANGLPPRFQEKSERQRQKGKLI